MSTPEPAPTVIPEWSFADRLRKIRREVVNVGQVEMADMLGVTSTAYTGWESGRGKPRDIVAIARRVKLLTGVPAEWVLGLDQPDRTPTSPVTASAPNEDSPSTFSNAGEDGVSYAEVYAFPKRPIQDAFFGDTLYVDRGA